MILGINTLVLLDLSDNLITSIPDDIGNLQNLQQLRLANNAIPNVPATIGNLIINLRNHKIDWIQLYFRYASVIF